MEWILDLISPGRTSIASTMVLYSFVIAAGIYLGKLKILGVSLGVTFVLFVGIIVGQLLGANKLDEAVDTDRKLIVFSVAICFAIGGAMALLSPYIPNIYTAQPAQVRALASKFILIVAIAMPITSLANATYFTMRSGGKTFMTFLFDSGFMWVFGVNLAFCLSRFTNLSILPLFAICQLPDILKCILGQYMLKKGTWIHNLA